MSTVPELQGSAAPHQENEWFDDSDFESENIIPVVRSKESQGSVAVKQKTKNEFSIGDQFNSFSDLRKTMKHYEADHNCVFYIRDSVTIQQSRKKGITKSINSDVKYYWLKYCCIHGGKKFKSQSAGQRSSSTFQKECTANFSFSVSSGGTKLILTGMSSQHNHQCSEKLYRHLPQVRGLSAEERVQVHNLLSLGANKKKVKDKMTTETGKEVLLKDLSNIIAREEGQNNLQQTVDKLRDKFGADCYVYEEENRFKGLFFATEEMKRSMDSYPEFLGIDATFKLLDIRAPIYLMIIEDSEGSTEIVAVCILVSEDAASMKWMLGCFKKVHSAWTRIKSVMADKDLLERRIIKEEFPFANVLICIFHSLRTFNREIACEKFGITPGQRDNAKEIFQKMLYSSTESEYMQYYEQCDSLPKSIMTYFNNNWHNIRHEWTLTKDFMQQNFLNTTNNRVESLNAKIKSVVKRYSTLEEFVESFFILVACLHSERDHKAAFSYQKTLVIPFKKNSSEWLYCDLLTRFAFNFVRNELTSFRRGKFVTVQESDGLFRFQVHGSQVYSSPQSCDCTSFVSMMLPCRHIFVVRERLGYDLFDVSICNERWTRQYFCKTQRVFDDNGMEAVDVPVPTVSSSVPEYRISSQNERYRNSLVITRELCSLTSEVTGDEYLQRLKTLADIKNAWIKNRRVSVSEMPSDSTNLTAGTSIPSDIRPDSDCDLLPDDSVCRTYRQCANKTNDNKSSDDEAIGTVVEHHKPPQTIDLSTVLVPPALKRKGRPKGHEKTIIGLYKKQKKNRSVRARPFLKLRLEQKAIIMLEWLVEKQLALSAVNRGVIIEVGSVKTRPNEVFNTIIDDDVNIEILKKYFSKDAWKRVQEVVERKKKQNNFLCAWCSSDLYGPADLEGTSQIIDISEEQAIRCDYCLLWFHFPCVKLKQPPKTKIWKCSFC